MNECSPRFKLNAGDTHKSSRTFLVSLVAATVAFVSSLYLGWNYVFHINGDSYDLSMYAVPFITFLLELGRRWVSANKPGE